MIDWCFVKTLEQVFNGHCDRWEGSYVLIVILIISLSSLSSLYLSSLSLRIFLVVPVLLVFFVSTALFFFLLILTLQKRCAKGWTRIVEWHNCDCCRGGQVSNGCFCTSSVSTYRYARQTWRPTMDFGTEVVCYAGWQMLSVSCAPGVWNVPSEGAAQDRWQICDSLWEDPKQTSGKPTNK